MSEIEAIRARWAGDVEDSAVFPSDFVEVEMSPLDLALWNAAPGDICTLLARIDELLNEAWGDSLTVIAAAQRYRAAVVAMNGIAEAEAALFAALDEAGDAP